MCATTTAAPVGSNDTSSSGAIPRDGGGDIERGSVNLGRDETSGVGGSVQTRLGTALTQDSSTSDTSDSGSDSSGHQKSAAKKIMSSTDGANKLEDVESAASSPLPDNSDIDADEGGDSQQLSREDQANCLSRWFLSYLTPLLRLGASKVLTPDDVGVPSKQDRADLAFEAVTASWRGECDRAARKTDKLRAKEEAKAAKKRRRDNDSNASNGGVVTFGDANGDENKRKQRLEEEKAQKVTVDPSLSMALLKAFGVWKVLAAIGLYIVAALLTFVPVLLLNDLVKFFEMGGTTANYQGYAHPWVEVVGLAVFPLITSLFQTRHSFLMTHFAVFVRSGCSTLLYNKSLRISATGRAKTSTGQVVNMMSNDTNQIMRFLQFAGMSFVAPVQIIISLSLIFLQVGNAMWVGVGYMVVLVPVNLKIFGISGKMRREVLKFSDSRVKMMNEILNGIRIIKFYAWERPMGGEVAKIREEELKALTKLTYVSQIGFSVILMSAPIVQILLVFLTFIRTQDEPLTASRAFTTVALFQIMRFPFAILPMGFLQYIQSKIAIRRIGGYLQLPELENSVVDGPHPDEPADGPGREVASITMRDASFAWVDPDADVKPLDGTKGGKGPGGNKRKGTKDKRKSSVFSPHRRSTKSTERQSDGGGANFPPSDNSSDDVENGTGRGSVTSDEADMVVLRDISCQIKSGSLVAVVGEVGSGKSSLLSAILGEMEAVGDQSKVYIPRGDTDGSKSNAESHNFTAYCAQTPWVVNDTVRGNIVFGREFDQRRYDDVLQACALLDDLAVLPAGDMTEIGERGINLSGGQKARVCLARSLYSSEVRVLLLDDPLSAVDAHVGEHLFNQAIAGPISKGVTRVLVTHHVHFLPRCDSVFVVEDGRIAHQGRYADLVEQGVDFSGAIEVAEKEVEEDGDSDALDDFEKAMDQGTHHSAISQHSVRSVAETVASNQTSEEEDAKKEAKMKEKGQKLIGDEERNEGSVAGKAYLQYAKAGGLCPTIFIILSQAASRGFEIGASFWLAYWSDQTVSAILNGNPLTDGETSFYLYIYSLLGVLSIAGLAGRGLGLAVHRLKASRWLHSELTSSILRAPVSFFDVTPTGRVLNRFAYDMDKIDLELANSIGQGLTTLFSVLGALGAIIAATKGTFLIPLVPIGYGYYVIQKFFRKTSTELQRLTSMSMSPIFADFSSTLTGTPTIRAYGEQNRFFDRCMSSFNKNNASYVLVQLSGLWLGLRLDVLGGFVGAFIGGLAVATASSDFIPAGWLGLALSFSNEITSYLKHGVRMLATLEADMSSVERIFDYAFDIDHEAPDEIPDKDPAEGTWPDNGEITISNASMRYRDGPLVLKNLSLNITGGEKVGVVGRTGSGKSSLMIALFRISELEDDGGKIIIDEIDTSEIGTRALRSNLSIIPQDPVLFSNTVRYNLDPFGEKTDEELWSCLKKVRLGEVIATLPNGLEEQVAEGGENFSQGQRQLLCIARSLLRNPKVLVMDEATASIDNTTDAAIQDMIRENFSDATVLTIAHRLNTIMDSDRVLVLDDGKVAEFASPKELLAKKDGIFASLVEKSRKSRNGEIEE